MKKLLDLLTEEVGAAFEKAGYKVDLRFSENNAEAGRVSVSNRPDLCEYQCNGAMALAKEQKCAPINIANAVAEVLKESPVFESVEAVMPGFINMNISSDFIYRYVADMSGDPKFGAILSDPKTIIVDYGGPNIAKALHVGHLRPAIIGESIKRILRAVGNSWDTMLSVMFIWETGESPWALL